MEKLVSLLLAFEILIPRIQTENVFQHLQSLFSITVPWKGFERLRALESGAKSNCWRNSEGQQASGEAEIGSMFWVENFSCIFF